MFAIGRKRTVKTVIFPQFERPLSGKADVQISIERCSEKAHNMWAFSQVWSGSGNLISDFDLFLDYFDHVGTAVRTIGVDEAHFVAMTG